MAGPLHGVTVIELAGIGPSPFAGMMLADMGARVIRIDRIPRPRRPVDDLTSNDTLVDRGRQSLAVDLKDPRGVQIVLKLIDRADILLEGYRPGVMEKLGLGPQVCKQRNKRLVYGRMTGWGQFGPLASAAGHDINYIAISGALSTFGVKNSPPTPPLNLVGDYGGGGMLLALGVVCALLEARQSGEGQVVDAAMVDGAALLMTMMYGLKARGQWNDQRESNVIDGGAHFYGVYECADGKYLSVGAIEPQFYRHLLDVCAISDPQFEDQWDQRNWPELKRKLIEVFYARTRDEWCALLDGSDACVTPVLDMNEAPQYPHNRARQTFVRTAAIMQPAPAPRFERTVSELPEPSPYIGENTIELLDLIGASDGEISALLEAQVVYRWPATKVGESR